MEQGIGQWEWVVDMDLNFVFSQGAEELIGFHDAELMGWNVSNLTREEYTQAASTSSKWELVEECRAETGWVWLHYVAEYVLSETGAVIGVCGVSQLARKNQLRLVG